MNEINVQIFPENKQLTGKEIEIVLSSDTGEALEYKILIGRNGKWNTLREFSKENVFKYKVDKKGSTEFLVQAKVEGSKLAFDYTARAQYQIVEKEEAFRIDEFYISSMKPSVGEKVIVRAVSNREDAVFTFLVKDKEGTRTLKNTSPEGEIEMHFTSCGEKEIILNSHTTKGDGKKSFSLSKKINVKKIKEPKIKKIKSSANPIVANKETSLYIETEGQSENTLYKFIKVDKYGKFKVLMEYSSRADIEIIEKEEGKHVLLCYIKDMFSMNEYDDRAKFVYKVQGDEKSEIKEIFANVESPQEKGKEIKVTAVADNRSNILYRFQIHKIEKREIHMCTELKPKGIETKRKVERGTYDKKVFDSQYIATSSIVWLPEEIGEYKIKCRIKRHDQKVHDHESEIYYVIKEVSNINYFIKKVEFDREINKLVKGQKLNIRVQTDQEYGEQFRFLLYKKNEMIYDTGFNESREANCKFAEQGEYKLSVMMKGRHSSKKFDSREVFIINVQDFIPGKIDYVLYDLKDYYMGDEVEFEILSENSNQTEFSYNLIKDSMIIEEGEYHKNNKLKFMFLENGRYQFEMFCRNVESNQKYDHMKRIVIDVLRNKAITWSRADVQKKKVNLGEEVLVNGFCSKKSGVEYEFYIHNNKGWKLYQKYSAKNFFTFMPKREGEYRILMLVKHLGEEKAYEHYSSCVVEVTNRVLTPQM